MKEFARISLSFAAAIASLIGFVPQASATSDGHTHAYIVVRHVQSGEYFVERAPMIGCYGELYRPVLEQFTAPYKASANLGCGMPQFFDDINYLSCATMVDATPAANRSTITDMKIDISKCDDKDNADLHKMIVKAARMNFPQVKRTNTVKVTIVR